MDNKISIMALLLAGLVCGFLILQWVNPSSSLTLLYLMIAAAVVSIIFAIMGIKKQKSILSITALTVALASAGTLFALVAIIFIMGMGA